MEMDYTNGTMDQPLKVNFQTENLMGKERSQNTQTAEYMKDFGTILARKLTASLGLTSM